MQPSRSIPLAFLLSSLLGACAPNDFRTGTPSEVAIKQGGQVTHTLKIERDEKFTAPITVKATRLPAGVSATEATIAPGQTTASITLTAQPTAPLVTVAAPGDLQARASEAGEEETQAPVTFTLTGGEKTHTQDLYLSVKPLSGSLDKTFGKNGLLIMKYGNYLDRDHASTVTVDGKGRILLGGYKDDRLTVLRLTGAGKIDKTFGVQGFAQARADGPTSALLLDQNGRITLVGETMYETGNVMLARFKADGTLDATFGQRGTTTYAPKDFKYYGAADAVMQADGKIIVVGNTGNDLGGSGGIRQGYPMVVRFLPDGTIDRGFGKGGRVTGATAEHGRARAVAIGPNDTIYVLGTAHDMYDTGQGWESESSGTLYLARYLDDGSLDTSFGNKGFVTHAVRYAEYGDAATSHSSGIYAADLLVLPDGKVLTVSNIELSYNDDMSTSREVRLTQYLPDGARDPEFGAGGHVTLLEGESSAQSLQATKGGYLLTGTTYDTDTYTSSAFVVKLLKDGTLDPEFSFDGQVSLGTLEGIAGLAELPDGRFIGVTRRSPYFQDYDDNDVAEPNLELTRIHP